MAVKRYKTHNNGGRPYFVDIDGKTVSVSKNMNTFKKVDGEFVDIEKEPKHLLTVKADTIFIGKKSPKGDYDGLRPKEAEGNSILLNIGPKYMYIGHMMYEFSPIKGDTIVSYYSNIGNNDVPYPYAIGKTHVYILLDNVAIEKSFFDMSQDIYDQHYYAHRVHMCLFGNPKSDLCKDKSVYEPRIKEWEDKTTKLKIKQIAK